MTVTPTTGTALWLRQIAVIASLEWRKSLLSRRGLWVYALAFLPALLFGINSYQVSRTRAAQARIAQSAPNAPAIIESIHTGERLEAAIEKLRANNIPYNRFRRGRLNTYLRVSDGNNSYDLHFREEIYVDKRTRDKQALVESIRGFAGAFQFFYLRLAIFFGCVGIFMNLFRGELLDQSLHYYLLSPVRREVLMLGKYAAGIIATSIIFCSSTALQLFLLLSAHSDKEVADYLAGPGWGHIFAYLGTTVMACVGYGSIFLAAGVILKNPLIPAVVIQFWEGLNWFLPAILQKFSVIYYLQSLCPVVAPVNSDLPDFLKLLIAAAPPIATPIAVLSLLAFSALILFLASFHVRRLEINYGSE
jgi:ABC-type transport system involved in multi-copper enzyme maturation permease subunit